MIFSFSFFFFGLDVPWNFLLTSSLLLLVFVCSMLLLAIKLHQHLSFQCSQFKSFCNVATSRVFTMKLCQHLFLYWSHANIYFCRETTATLRLHRSHANVHHFICTEAMKLCQQFIFAMKSWQHSTLVLKSCQYSFWPRDHVNTSY